MFTTNSVNNDIYFSVMICCYNSEKYLSETIESVINQTYTNWEIVLINDGSSDDTEEIILNYKRKGIPIIYHKQENMGFAAARNKAVELAKSKWIAIIDHDDICLSNRLAIQSTHIRKHSNAKLFFANAIHFNDEGVEIRRMYDRFNPCKLDLSKGKGLNHLFVHGNFIASSVVVFNKEAALNIGGFNTEYKFVVDADFFKRIGSKYDMYAGKETLVKWRVHTDQATQKMKSIIHKEGNQTFIKYFFFEGVNNKARLSMIFNLFKRYVKQSLIKLKLIS